MSERIAIIGISCRYPGADSPAELWEDVLAGRRAFRQIPDERMRLEDYWSPDPAAPDRFYSPKAAVIEGFSFDRVRYKIAGSTYRAADLTHWLALDTAARALADAGFPGGKGLPKTSTGVVVGNTLTGEFSRANLLRLRWPYVRRILTATLQDRGFDDAALADLLIELEEAYKNPFPPVDEDTLAGGLSNTIAGRICNYFDLKGGGYTVDGACSSSLLSVATACNALSAGDMDAAVAGGVDLSIDPFEIIGFAKTGALATADMRVYDKKSNGFWPGEGCGMIVLVRQEDADKKGLRSYAAIAGWGYSSDGKGSLTRPEVSGHRLAIRRAYERAGFDMGTVAYLEGHGTGTAVGDAAELRALSDARRSARPDALPAAISTIKANIGHTKAAAGVAGLIKATLAVHHQVIPPATGHTDTHPELLGDNPALYVPAGPQLWPVGLPVRAAVSSMGFGGINTHLVLEHPGGTRRTCLDARTSALARSRQDCELLLLTADDVAEIRGRLAHLATFSSRLSYAELGDLAAALEQEADGRDVRAAVVAATPQEAERGFARLIEMLDGGARAVVDTANGIFLGRTPATPPRIGYLFPGQGTGSRGSRGSALPQRFHVVDDLFQNMVPPSDGDLVATAAAQPRVVTLSAAGLRVLSVLAIEAAAAAGHSLGELTSLYWAGAMDEPSLLRLAATRGRAMAEASHSGGTMASIAGSPGQVEPLLAGEPVVIAGYNSPRQTVISGPIEAVDRVCRLALKRGLVATRLPVSHAFHSELVAPAAVALRHHLARERFQPLRRRVVSTVTGDVLPADTDVCHLLERQVREPVRFAEAVARMATDMDLLVEVGPGRVLSGLATTIAPALPAISTETDGTSLSGLLRAVAAAYVLGAPVRHDQLFAGRFSRPLPLDKKLRFFASPAESAPVTRRTATIAYAAELPAPMRSGARDGDETPASGSGQAAVSGSGEASSSRETLQILRRLAAERAELPLFAVRPDSHPLDDLHLSSITVGQIVNQVARELGLPPPMASTAFATSTLAELARMLDDFASTGPPDKGSDHRQPEGVTEWVRPFAVELIEAERPPADSPAAEGRWQLYSPARHPLAVPLQKALSAARLGHGVLLCLPPDCDERHLSLMLEAARAALAQPGPSRFVVVQTGRGASGLAKTLHLEAPSVATSVISLPVPAGSAADAVQRIVADVAATSAFSEIVYDEAGTRLLPVLRPVKDTCGTDAGPRLPLGPGDVLLVTGGGKGITAECALALAADAHAAVALLGRSDPDADEALAANLRRMAAAGVRFRYIRADVTSADEVRTAVEEARATLGPVTAVLHGAGHNEPAALVNLDEAAFRRTLAPKISGLENVLAAADPASLRLLVTFGSIIGRTGLRGQADYATANDWLSDLTRSIHDTYPQCRCVALEWSVWSGAGMGERLGVLESLVREGITPISLEDGVAALRKVLANPRTPPVTVLMGRAGELPTITLPRPELPLTRFLEQPRVYYPGIELVADAELSTESDPYLADHRLDGHLLFPAVLGMEAMAQVAAALTGRTDTPVLENVAFARPIVIPDGDSATIRVAALHRDGSVEAVIRTSETGFQADHFRAEFRYPRREAANGQAQTAGVPAAYDHGPGDDGAPLAADHGALPAVPMRPEHDLYGHILFQGGQFKRLLGYRQLAATGCVAEISNVSCAHWFAMYLPGSLVLGDPGTRDAFMHAIQCCVPDATLLPAAVSRIYVAERDHDAEQVVVCAAERHRDGDTFIYDFDVRSAAGRLLERWQGLRLHAVRRKNVADAWIPALLGPYLERQLAGLLPHAPRCVIEPDGQEPARSKEARRRQTAVAVSRILREPVTVRYRSDGKPEVDADVSISSSHNAGLTFSVAGPQHVGCDVEPVRDRLADDWLALLGPQRFALAQLLCEQEREELAVAATRVWGAVECLRKIGRAAQAPITVAESGAGRWVLLRSGQARIATFPARLRDVADMAMFAILVEGGSDHD